MRLCSLLRWVCASTFLVAALVCCLRAEGAVVWTGATSSDWDNPANWTGSLVNGSDVSFDVVPNQYSYNNLATGSLTLKSATFTTGGYTVSGSALNITDKISSTAGSNVWYIDTTFTGTSGALIENTSIAATTDTLTIYGQVNFGANLLTLSAAANQKLDIYGTLAGTSGGLRKTGDGLAILEYANNYTGATTISGGTLEISNADRLGTDTALNIDSNASLRVTGYTALGATRTFTIGTGGATLDVAGSLDVDGLITGGAGNNLTKTGVGTLRLIGTASNTIQGDIYVNQGELHLNSPGLNPIGSANLYINSSNTASSSGVGPARIILQTSDQIPNTANVTISANGGQEAALDLYSNAETLGGTITISSTTVGGAGIRTGGSGTLTVLSNITFNNNRNAAFNNAREVFISSTGSRDYSSSGGTLNLGNAVRTITVNSTSPANIGGADAAIDVDITNGGLIKQGPRRLFLNGTSNFTGGLTVNQGVVVPLRDESLGAAGVIQLNGGGIGWDTPTTWAPGAAYSFNFGTAGGTIEVIKNLGTMYISNAGQLTGSGAVTKTGLGALQIDVANAGLTGNWNIKGGAVQLQNLDALGSGTLTVSSDPNWVNIDGDVFAPSTGELVASNSLSLPNTWKNITLAGGRLSMDFSGGNIAAPVSVTADSSIGVRHFQSTGTPTNFTIATNLTGTGKLTAQGPTAGSTNGVLTLTGNNAGLSGPIAAGTRATVVFQGLNARSAGGIRLEGGVARVVTGLSSAPSTGQTLGADGLNAYYYNFGTNEGGAVANSAKFATDLLAIPQRVFTRVDQTVNIPNQTTGTQLPVWLPGTVVGNNQDNNGGFWKGLIKITTAGSYTFESASDDGSMLYIDGQVVVSNDGGHAYNAGTPTGAPVTLSAGWHAIALRWAQGGSASAMMLSYTGPDTASNKVVVGSIANTLNTGSLTALAIGPLSASSGSLDLPLDASASSLTFDAAGSFSASTYTISTLSIDGPTTLNGSNTIASPGTSLTPAGIVFNGAIGQATAGSGLTLSSGFTATVNQTSTYTGTTTVTAGQLILNATGGNAVPGDLLVNASSTAANRVVNVLLQKANQIADGASVTVQGRSTVDFGTFSDTIGSLTVKDEALLLGTGKLTIQTALDLQSGWIQPGLGGAVGISKTSAGTVILAGNSDYTGAVSITGGALNVRHSNALGAATAGTSVGGGAQLQVQGNIISPEAIALAGDGLVSFNSNMGALRNVSGYNTVAGVTLTGNTLIRSDAGAVVLGALDMGGNSLTVTGAGGVALASAPTNPGAITLDGAGALVYGYNVGATFPALTWTNGTVGFNGPQSFGAYTLATGKSLLFASDPGAGVSITAAAGSKVFTAFAANQSLLSRLNAASAGTLVLGVDSANNLNLIGYNSLALGASGPVTYSGTLTPGAAGFLLGGGGGDLRFLSEYTGAQAVTVGADVRWIAVNPDDLGKGQINLNGGTIIMPASHTSSSAGASHTRFERTLNVMAAGGTVEVPYYSIAILRGDNLLTGSGTLTMSGRGEFAIASLNTAFTGQIVVAPNANMFELRGDGTLMNATGITVNNGGIFRVNNNDSVAYIASANILDRLGNSIPITMKGGGLNYNAKNLAGSISETVGVVTLAEGQSRLTTNAAGQGANFTVSDLIRPVGGGTVVFTATNSTNTTASTIGGTAQNDSRFFLTKINGSTSANTNLIGGWANINYTDFAAYDATPTTGVGVKTSTYTTAIDETAFLPANVVNQSTDVTLYATREVQALRMSGTAAVNIGFVGGADTLFITSGGLLSSNENAARNIGTSLTRGRLTAGPETGNAAPRELFIGQNSNTMTVDAVIVDNNSQPVTLYKTLAGTLQLNTENSYSGGTKILGGRVNVAVAGGLGSGNVFAKGGQLQLNQPGAISGSTGMYEAIEGTEVYLQNGTGVYTAATDRFILRSGSAITGDGDTAGQGLNSLTRVYTTPTNAGEIYLEPGTVVRPLNPIQGPDGAVINTIKNLGTAADLYICPGGSDGITNPFFSVTVGAGTPWKGLSSSVGARFAQGTIVANSDFYLQGPARNGAYVTLNMGKPDSVNSWQVVNNSSGPLKAYIEGIVAFDDDQSPVLPSDLTIVVTPGAVLQPNYSRSFGMGPIGASVLVQAGGTLNPSNYVQVGATGNQPALIPYPADSPINANTTLEAGGRLMLDDASGLGGSDATITVKKDGIVHLNNGGALLGNRAGGLIRDGQLSFEPGGILRHELGGLWGLDAVISGEPAMHQVYGNNRRLTDVTYFPGATVAVPARTPQDLSIGAGGGLTNDSNSRTLQGDLGGHIYFLGDGVIAATTNTQFDIQDDFDIAAGATITIGSLTAIDGDPKLGVVNLSRSQGNYMGAGSKFSILPGVTLQLDSANVIGNLGSVELPSGATLLLSANGWWETVDALNGGGVVTSNEDNAHLQVGAGNSSFTFTGSIVQTSGKTFQMAKIGTGDFTITSTLGTAAGNALRDFFPRGGKTLLSGPAGKLDTTSNLVRVERGATLVLDNTAAALSDRLSQETFEGRGGTLVLKGNANTAVSETFPSFDTDGGGGTTIVRVEHGAASTTMNITAIEDTNGGRNTVYLFQGSGLAGTPGTMPANGLVKVTTPNFLDVLTSPPGVIGSPLMWTRPDVLADPAGTGNARFATQDVSGASATGLRPLADSEYSPTLVSTGNRSLNVKTGAALAATGDTRINTLTMTGNGAVTVTGTYPQSLTPARLHLDSPGIITENGATATITTPLLQAVSGRNLYVHTLGNSTLTINGPINSDRGFFKGGDGTLTINGTNAVRNIRRGNWVTLAGGTLVLNGAGNSFGFSQGNGNNSGIDFAAIAGTLELGGNSQFFGTLESRNPIPGTGTTIQNSGPAATLVVAPGAGCTFSGSINGNLAFIKDGTQTLTLTNANTYNGKTAVLYGTLNVVDSATLLNTSKVELVNSTLALDNRGLAQIDSRLPAGVNVDMTNALLQVYGWGTQIANEQLGTVTLKGGRNEFRAEPGNGGFAQIAIANLVRSADSIVNFQTGNSGSLGNVLDSGPGAYHGAQVKFAQLDGAAPTSGFLGGWAIINNNHFAWYDTFRGVMQLDNTNYGAPNYTSNTLTGLTSATNLNISNNATYTLTSGATVNSLRVRPDNTTSTLTLNAGVQLDVASGGLIIAPVNGSAAATITGGTLSTTNPYWYIYAENNASTIASVISGASAAGGLVKAGGAANLTLTGNNTYLGKTSVNVGTLTLNTPSANGTSVVAIPGDLEIRNATVTASTAGQIKTGSNLTIYGAGFLGLAAGSSESFATVTFNAEGGSDSGTKPRITGTAAATSFAISGANAITAHNASYTGAPTLDSNLTSLLFTGADGTAQTIHVTGGEMPFGTARATGLYINVPINDTPAFTGSDGGLVKTGAGLLGLNATNLSMGGGALTTGSSSVTVTSTAGLVVGQYVTGTGIPNYSTVTAITDATHFTISNAATATNTGQTFTAYRVSAFSNPTTPPTQVLKVSNGLLRADSAGALGTNKAVTVVQNGAVLLGNAGTGLPILGNITLEAGATLGCWTGDWLLGIPTLTPADATTLAVTGNSTVWDRGYTYADVGTATITINGKLTGAGNLDLLGPTLISGSTFRLGNPIGGTGAGGNDYSGTITVNPNVTLLAQPQLAGTNTSVTGNVLGTAPIVLNGGRLNIRDDGSLTNTTVTGATFAYGNNVTLKATSAINADRTNASASANTIALGTLTIDPGTHLLNVDSGQSYRISFTNVLGSGTMLKTSGSILTLTAIDPSFTGGLGLHGPDGIAVAAAYMNGNSGSLILPSPATLPTFIANGHFKLAASQTMTLTNRLVVGSNAGTVVNGTGGVTTGSTTGAYSLRSDGTVTTPQVVNNGILGVQNAGAAVTLQSGTTTLMTIKGSGLYQTYDTQSTPTRNLTLNGNLVDDGANATTLKVAGNATVSITPDAAGTNSGGAQVQSGTLRVAPAASSLGMTNPLGTGPITTLGMPAMTLAANNVPVAAVNGTLQFDPGAGNTLAQAGNITNSGVVRVSSGVVNLSGTIAGPGAAAGYSTNFIAGLLEGYEANATFDASATRPANKGQFGIKLEPRMGQSTVLTEDPVTGWVSNVAWVYTGQFYDADGLATFAENIDDRALVVIDGVTLLAHNGDKITNTAVIQAIRGTALADENGNIATVAPTNNIGMGPNGDGWHTIEIRFHNATGSAGPRGASNGFDNNFGFGLSQSGTTMLDGALYTRPIDPGDASLFRTAINAKGNVQVDAGATLNVPQVTMTNRMVLGAAATGATLNLNAGSATASTVDNLQVTGPAGSTAALKTNANTSLTVGGFTAPQNVTLTHDAPANRMVITGDAVGGTINSIGTAGVTFNSSSAQLAGSVIAGAGGLVKQGAGVLSVAMNNTYSGDTVISAGTLRLGATAPGSPVAGASTWLDASDLTTLTVDGGGKVSQWNDKANSHNAVQLTATNQPLSTTNALIGGKSVIQMDGTAAFMNLDLTSLANSPYTIIALEGRTSTKTENYVLGTGAGSNNTSLHFGYRADAQVTLAQYGNDINGTVPGYTSQQFSMLVGVLDTAVGHALYRDGVLLNSSTSVVPFTTADAGVIGKGFGTGRYYAGDLAEVFIYPRALSASELTAMQTYLTQKWLLGSNVGFIPDGSAVSVAADSAFDLNGYSETIGSLAASSGTAAVSLGTGTLTTGGNGESTTFAGAITGTGGLVKTGGGVMTLTGANSYSGPTDVQAGKLVVNGSVTGAGNVTVASGATLGGSGTLAGAVAVQTGGVIAPNGLTSDTGTLNLGSTLTINGTAKFELGAAASDKIVVIGAADFNGGTLDVTALTVGGPTFTNGQVFDLFDYASYTNPFTTINLPLLTGGLQWKSFGAQQFDYTNGQIVVESTVVTSAIRTWNGGSGEPSGNNLWSTAANWGTSGVPVNNTPKDELVFGGGTWLANNNDIASLSVGKLTFASGAGGFDLQGTALEIAGKIDNQATTAQKISLNVTFAAGTETATLNVVNGGSLELAGAVNSTLGLTKTGLGTAKLSAGTGTTYSGPTLVNEGTLEVTKGINLVADTDDTTVGTSTTTATLITEHIRQDVLTINAGSKVKISATGGAASTSVVNVLNIANASGSFSWSVPGGDISPASTGGPVASGAAVPEPATWLLAVIAALAGLVAWRRRK